LGLTFWRGAFEESTERDWLRWCDADGQLIPLGEERAQAETERANAAEARAAWLEKKLREMGVETP
jgi:hypothetical protein